MNKFNPKFKHISVSSDNPCNQTIFCSITRQTFVEKKYLYSSKEITFSCGSEDAEAVRQSIINKPHVVHLIAFYADRVQIMEDTFIRNISGDSIATLPIMNKTLLTPYHNIETMLTAKFSDNPDFRIERSKDMLTIGSGWSFNFIMLPYNKMDIVFYVEDLEEYEARMEAFNRTPEKERAEMIVKINKFKNEFIQVMNKHNKENNLPELEAGEKQLLETYNNFLIKKAEEDEANSLGC